jgi:hypothetical protein
MGSGSRSPTDWDAVAQAAHDAYAETYGPLESDWTELSEKEKRAWIAACTAGVASFLRERLAARARP